MPFIRSTNLPKMDEYVRSISSRELIAAMPLLATMTMFWLAIMAVLRLSTMTVVWLTVCSLLVALFVTMVGLVMTNGVSRMPVLVPMPMNGHSMLVPMSDSHAVRFGIHGIVGQYLPLCQSGGSCGNECDGGEKNGTYGKHYERAEKIEDSKVLRFGVVKYYCRNKACWQES